MSSNLLTSVIKEEIPSFSVTPKDDEISTSVLPVPSHPKL